MRTFIKVFFYIFLNYFIDCELMTVESYFFGLRKYFLLIEKCELLEGCRLFSKDTSYDKI